VLKNAEFGCGSLVVAKPWLILTNWQSSKMIHGDAIPNGDKII
jgi:hypothetical protein